jgi:hypothetical protein
LAIELRRTVNQMAAQGQLYSGALPRQLAFAKRGALQQYRDEMIRKRRQYRDLCDDQGGRLTRLLRLSGAVPPFELDDPTSDEREPDLRRWEADGDRCDGGST